MLAKFPLSVALLAGSYPTNQIDYQGHVQGFFGKFFKEGTQAEYTQVKEGEGGKGIIIKMVIY